MVLLYENKHASRVIPLDGRSHVGESIKLFMGDSRGRWEGNTLVVDVTNQNGRAWLDVLSFHGEGLHVVEQWTPVGPDRIDYRATLTDPTMFTQPWTIAYRKVAAHLSQFSTFRAGTRLNSVTLSVTQIASMARACAAINMSWAPIGVPRFSRATRIEA